MSKDHTARLARKYIGSMVVSTSDRVMPTEITIEPLTTCLAKVNFKYGSQEYFFRAMLSLHEQGLVMVIKDRVTESYMLSGIGGFVHDRPNVHGGLIESLNSFYFHVGLTLSGGMPAEIYFIGKPASLRENFQAMKRARFQSVTA